MSLSRLQQAAQATLDRNWRDGYTVPSPRLYPFQWNWDSGFIALGWAYHRPERAIEELRRLFTAQWSNGMLPHIAFHRPDPNYFPGPDAWRTEHVPLRAPTVATSGITQPPVFGFILERISALPCGQTAAWRQFLRDTYPRVVALHRYLYTHRDPHGEGLVYIQHNWEAGTDNSPAYDAILDRMDISRARDVSALRRDVRAVDAAHRPTNANYQRYLHLVDLFIACDYRDADIARTSPFLVQDILFNSVLVRSNLGLIRLGRTLGENTAELEAWNRRTIAAIQAKLWDSERGFYFSYDLRAQRRIPVKTSSGFMPLFAQIPDRDQTARLASHLTTAFAPDDRWRLCASTATDEPSFEPVKYWRGPVWVNVNWMLLHGLARAGLAELAERMRRDTLGLLEQHGLWEYFDPRPSDPRRGVGLGTDGFSWSAALALDLLHTPDPL